MALDYFDPVYQGTRESLGAYGQALRQIAALQLQQRQDREKMQVELAKSLYPSALGSSYSYPDPATGGMQTISAGGNPQLAQGLNSILSRMGIPMPATQQPDMQQQGLGSLLGQTQGLPSNIAGVETIGGKTKFIRKSPTLLSEEDAKSQASKILQGIQNKSKGFVPDLVTGWGNPKLRAELVTQAIDKGVDLQSPILQWQAAKRLTQSMNSTQVYQLQSAIGTVRGDLPQLRRLSSEFQRTGFTPLNKVILGARLRGIDFMDATGQRKHIDVPQYEINQQGLTKDQVQVATQFITQLNLMKDNLAVAFVRGGVPTDQSFKLANDILNPAYGMTQLDAGLDQVETNLDIRENAFASPQPMVPQDFRQSSQPAIFSTPVGQALQSGQQTMDDKTAYQEYLKIRRGG